MIIIARFRQIIDGLLNYVQQDYEAVPEEETLLYQMFYGTHDRNFDFYQKAKEIFLRRNTSPRKLRTVLEYPKDKSHMPCIVIKEPARKQVKDAPIGGYGMPTLDQFGSEDFEREGFRQPSFSSVNIMCFSDNTLESILICEVLYTLLIGARNTLEEEFTTFQFNTEELIAQNNLFPTPILVKSINVEIEEIDRYASIIRPEVIRKMLVSPAVVVGTDPNWNPPEPTKYFSFGSPYVWLDKDQKGVQNVYSNTDWILTIGEVEEPFTFGDSYVWLSELTNKGTQKINARPDVHWTLE